MSRGRGRPKTRNRSRSDRSRSRSPTQLRAVVNRRVGRSSVPSTRSWTPTDPHGESGGWSTAASHTAPPPGVFHATHQPTAATHTEPSSDRIPAAAQSEVHNAPLPFLHIAQQDATQAMPTTAPPHAQAQMARVVHTATPTSHWTHAGQQVHPPVYHSLPPHAAQTSYYEPPISYHVPQNTISQSRQGERLDTHVSENLIDDILKGSAINMYDIFRDDPRKSNQIDNDSTDETKGKKPKKERRLSRQDWLEAFTIYAFIVSNNDPSLAPGLFVHLAKVLELQAARADWHYYDVTVRKKIEKGWRQWADPCMEEKMEARARPELQIPRSNSTNTRPQTNSLSRANGGRGKATGASVPWGFCFDFHKWNDCSNEKCSWAHKCYICKSEHSASSCSGGRGSFRSSSNRPFRGQSGPRQGSFRGGNPTKSDAKVVTPIRVDRLYSWLSGYDEDLKQYLISGFSNGFRIGFTGNASSEILQNHGSAKKNTEVVDNYLKNEVKAGRIFGPISKFPQKFHCSPLGLVPKKDKNDFRVIHDLSFPPGQSVNDFIPPEHTSVSYEGVYDAIYMLCKIGHAACMAKTDIEKAFRLIPIHPDDQHLFCIYWNGELFMDRALQMGCSSSCQIFQAFASAISWIGRVKLNVPNVSYLDDFLLGSQNKRLGKIELQKFLDMCKDIGIPMSEKKTYLPDTTMVFLGIEIDTQKREVRLPLDKVEQCANEIKVLLKRDKTRLRYLQSIIGLLNFACQVVVPGRAFLRRLIDLTRGVRSPMHWIRLKPARDDLLMWLDFLESHNGRVFFVDEKVMTNHDVSLYTDSSGLGYGAWFGSAWFFGEWSHWWKQQHIMFLELYPIVIALEIWGKQLCNKRLRLFTDNLSLVSVLSKQTSTDPLVMILVRRLVLTCLRRNIVIDARHIVGATNVLADLLSRLDVQGFKQRHKGADSKPSVIPLLPESLS